MTIVIMKIDEELELRMLNPAQAGDLFFLVDSCRAYLKEWLPWVQGIKTVKEISQFIEMARKQAEAKNGFQAGIWYRGILTGVIGYHGINRVNRSTSIGYWLGENHQGKGIMTRACKAMTDYAFGRLKLNRVEIRCAEKNEKSRAVPERLGFVKEGVVREAEWLYDHYVDHVLYGMLAREWITTL